MDFTNSPNTTYSSMLDESMNSTDNSTTDPLPDWYYPLERAHTIVLTTILIFIMLSMGCAVEIPIVIKHLKRPWPIMVGAGCQFLIFPAIAFGYVNAIQMETLYALGCVILSCSPGGGISNMFTYWVDGDVSLSIVMTVVSTVLAFVLMPLNIFIYTRLWVDELSESAIVGSAFTVIPYDKLFIALASTLGPTIIGVLIRRKSIRIANLFSKIGSVIAFINIPAVIVMQAFLYEWYKIPMWQLWLSSITMPFIGFAIGFFISKLLCQPAPVPRTVAFETGSQNVPLASSVIALGFSTEIVQKVILFPTLYGVLQLVNGFVPVALYRLYRWYRPMKQDDSSEEVLDNSVVENNPVTKSGLQNKSYAKDTYLNGVSHQNGTLQTDDDTQESIPPIARAYSKGDPTNFEFASSV